MSIWKNWIVGAAAGSLLAATALAAEPPNEPAAAQTDSLLSIVGDLVGSDLPSEPSQSEVGLRLLRAMETASHELSTATTGAMDRVQSLKNPTTRRKAAAIRAGEASIRNVTRQAQDRMARIMREELAPFVDVFGQAFIDELVKDARSGLLRMRNASIRDLKQMGEENPPTSEASAALGTYVVQLSDPTGRFTDVVVGRLTLHDDFTVQGFVPVARLKGLVDDATRADLVEALGARTAIRGVRWQEVDGRVEIIGPLGRATDRAAAPGRDLTVSNLSILASVFAVAGEDAIAGDDAQEIEAEFGTISDWLDTFTYRLVRQPDPAN